MPLTINTNVASMTARRELAASDADRARALQRLSSGLRVNSARDDAAGLAISERLTTQVRGLSQAARNANDGVSLLQTADGALTTVVGNLQRIRELAVQAANGSNSVADRDALGAEVRQRLAEIDRVASTTRFAGEKVFAQGTGSLGGDRNQRAVADGLRMSWLRQSEKLVSDYYGLTADGADLRIDITADSDGSGGYAAFVASQVGSPGGRGTNLRLSIDLANFTPPNLPNGGTAPQFNDRVIAHEMVHAVMARTTNWASLTSTSEWFVEGIAEFIHGADERVAADISLASGATTADRIDAVVDEIASWQLTSADYSAGYIGVRYLHEKLKADGYGGIRSFMQYLNGPTAPTMDQALTHFFGSGYTQASFLAEIQADSGNGLSNGVVFVQDRMNLANSDTGAIGGLDADGGPVRTAESVIPDLAVTSGDDVLTGFRETWERIGSGATDLRSASMQVGSGVGDTLDVRLAAVNVQALGLSEVDIARGTFDAARAILHVDAALEFLSGQRASLGAQMSRLEAIVSNLGTTVENAAATRSRIRDADYAAETAALTRAQILQQAGTAILAQANAQPRNVLSLLRS